MDNIKTEASQLLDREKKGSTSDDVRTSLINTASLSTNGPGNLILTPRQTSSNISNGALAYPTAALLKGPHQHAIAANVFGTMGVQQGGFNNSLIRGYPTPTNVLMTQYPALTTFPQGFGLLGPSEASSSRKTTPSVSNLLLHPETFSRIPPTTADASEEDSSTLSPKEEQLPPPSGSKRKATAATEESDEKKHLLSLKPKRPLSAYNFFFQEERSRLLGVPPCTEEEKKRRKHRKSHGKMAFTELAKHIGLKWKTLDADSKVVYEQKQQEDRKRYQKELGIYDQMIKEVHGAVEESEVKVVPRPKTAKTSTVKSEDKQKQKQKQPSSKTAAAVEDSKSAFDQQQGINNLAYANHNHQQMVQLLNMQKQQQQLAQLQAQLPFFPSGSASIMDPTGAMMQQRAAAAAAAAMDSRGQYERAVLAAMYENMVFGGQTPNGNAAGLGGMISNINGFFPSQGTNDVAAAAVDNRPTVLLTSGIPNFSNHFGAVFPPNHHQTAAVAAGNPALSAFAAAGLTGGVAVNANPFLSSLANPNSLGDLATTIRQQERQVMALQQQLQQQQQQQQQQQTIGNVAIANAGAMPQPLTGFVNANPLTTAGNAVNFPFNSSNINSTALQSIPAEEIAAISRQHQEQQMAALQQLQQQSQLGRLS